MTTAVSAARNNAPSAALIVAGVIFAAFAEAVAGTALSLGRGDIIGDIYATPDEFAWLDIAYVSFKLIGFITAPWLMTQMRLQPFMLLALAVMGAACGFAAITARLDVLIGLRVVQGMAGGALLVGGQSIIFLAYPLKSQPVLQALFAMGAVVAPTSVAPALQGWILDSQSWGWIFFAVIPATLLAAGFLLLGEPPALARIRPRSFDWLGFVLIAVALCSLTYALSQGPRWDWFAEPRILWTTLLGVASFLAFLGQQATSGKSRFLDISVFGSGDFAFAFAVSFVAGAALFGSAYLIPSFAVSMLSFTPSAAGLLLLPSGAIFACALLIAAYLMQARGLAPIATVPFGILSIMTAMWMLSGSASESGTDDMTPALLLRGFGLGFLFLSITLIAFTKLTNSNLASGIGLFNAGRQVGGLLGVAGIQTLIDDQIVANAAALGANISSGTLAANERLTTAAARLVANGVDAAAANQAALGALHRSVREQSALIAYDTAFNAVAALFVVAAPVLIAIKVALGRRSKARAALRSGSADQVDAHQSRTREPLG